MVQHPFSIMTTISISVIADVIGTFGIASHSRRSQSSQTYVPLIIMNMVMVSH